MLTEPDSQSMLCSPGSALGNRFSLITLVRKRARNLVDGSPPLVETDSRNPVSVALEEIHHGKVRISCHSLSETLYQRLPSAQVAERTQRRDTCRFPFLLYDRLGAG